MFLWTKEIHFAARYSNRIYAFGDYTVNGTFVPIRNSGLPRRSEQKRTAALPPARYGLTVAGCATSCTGARVRLHGYSYSKINTFPMPLARKTGMDYASFCIVTYRIPHALVSRPCLLFHLAMRYGERAVFDGVHKTIDVAPERHRCTFSSFS
jgi:hypothetical protein